MHFKRIFPAIILLSGISVNGFSQNTSNAELYKTAVNLRTKGQFHNSLAIFKLLLSRDSNNTAYLDYTAVLTCKTLHDDTKPDNPPIDQYKHCEYLAKKSLKLDTNNPESHYAYAFAIGVISEYASHKQQISIAGIMKSELDKTLKLNPHHAGAYHLLGRWFDKLAGFNAVEKLAVKLLYGATLPEGTYAQAAAAYEKAILYEPDYILHQYELAVIYHKMGKDADAKVWLNNAINAPYAGDDAQQVKDHCKKLLEELK
jgi:regulator of microtubule dynamics protein 3